MGKSLIDEMRTQIAKSGSSKKEILYFPADSVRRVRFLQELDSGFSFEFHSDFNSSIFELCQDPENHEECELCNSGVKLQTNFVWSVWDYDSNAVRLVRAKANGVSPIPALIEMFEEFGTIMDRDYKIKKVGKGQGSSYVVTPLDKERFKNAKAKPYTHNEVEKIFAEAYAPEKSEDEEEEVTTKKTKKAKKPKKEPTLREKFEQLDMEQLISIGKELGMTKKELKGFDDEEELLDEFFDNYEEEDLEDIYNSMDEDEED